MDTSSRLSIDRDRGDISYAFDPYDPGGNILVNRVIYQARRSMDYGDFSTNRQSRRACD